MFALQSVETIIVSLLFICAYGISVTITEVGQAWVASKLGDNAPNMAGWNSLNPFDHMDWIGTILVVLFHISFVRGIPLNSYSQQNKPYKMVRLGAIYFSQAFIALLLAFVSLTLIVILFGKQAINFNFSDFLHNFPYKSTFSILCGLLLYSLFVYNLLMAVLGLILNGLWFYLSHSNQSLLQRYSPMTVLLGTLAILYLLLLVLERPILILAHTLIRYGALFISSLFGIT